MGEVVPSRTSPTLPPHPLALCCHYPVSKCRSASIAVTGTVRVKKYQKTKCPLHSQMSNHHCGKDMLCATFTDVQPSLWQRYAVYYIHRCPTITAAKICCVLHSQMSEPSLWQRYAVYYIHRCPTITAAKICCVLHSQMSEPSLWQRYAVCYIHRCPNHHCSTAVERRTADPAAEDRLPTCALLA